MSTGAALENDLFIDFTDKGNALHFIEQGWSHQEPNAIWATGRESSVRLPPFNTESHYSLVIQCMPHLNEYRPAQRTVFSINGIEVGRGVIKGPHFESLSFSIPHRLLATATDTLPNILHIYHPDASIPADFEGGDIRDIAIYVHSIRIVQKSPDVQKTPRSDGIPNVDLMKLFESLGIDCEFGLVQRKWGAEPVGLFRFSAIGLTGLRKALNESLAHIGDHVEARVDVANEYMIHASNYDLRFHTFMYEGDPTEIERDMSRRLVFLKRKLLEDLQGRRKVFVFRQAEALREEDLNDLASSISRFGRNILLAVGAATADHDNGDLEVISEHLYRGYITSSQPLGGGASILYDDWLSLCRKAYAQANRVHYFIE